MINPCVDATFDVQGVAADPSSTAHQIGGNADTIIIDLSPIVTSTSFAYCPEYTT